MTTVSVEYSPVSVVVVDADVTVDIETSVVDVEIVGNIHYAAGADLYYLHIQSVASVTWNVTHNLGKYPAVTVTLTGGEEVEANIVHTDVNSLVVTLNGSSTGTAFCN